MKIFKFFKRKKKEKKEGRILETSFGGQELISNPHPPIAIKRMEKRLETVEGILLTLDKKHPKREEFRQAAIRLRSKLKVTK